MFFWIVWTLWSSYLIAELEYGGLFRAFSFFQRSGKVDMNTEAVNPRKPRPRAEKFAKNFKNFKIFQNFKNFFKI